MSRAGFFVWLCPMKAERPRDAVERRSRRAADAPSTLHVYAPDLSRTPDVVLPKIGIVSK